MKSIPIRWILAPGLALLALLIIAAPASADPDPADLPCVVAASSTTWIAGNRSATDWTVNRDSGSISDEGDDTFLSVDFPAPGVLAEADFSNLRAALWEGPAHASEFELRSDGSWHYVPHDGYLGGDSFEYVDYAPGGNCSRGATVTILPPVLVRAYDDVYTTRVNEPLYQRTEAGTFAFCQLVGVCGVLNNDVNIKPTSKVRDFVYILEDGRADPDHHREIVPVDHPTRHGDVRLYADGSFVYTPDPGFRGTDSFGYTTFIEQDGQRYLGLGQHLQTDIGWAPGGRLHFATVTIEVVDPPPLEAAVGIQDGISLDEDTTAEISAATLLANDQNAGFVYAINDNNFSSSVRTLHGTVAIHSELLPNLFRRITSLDYTPDADFVGTDVFRYSVADPGQNVSNYPGTVILDVAPVPDAPTAVRDVATLDENTSITIDVAANDSDADGDLDPASVVQDPDPCAHQVQIPSCTPSLWNALMGNGTWATNGDGTVTYTPPPGFTGDVEFPYQISDEGGLDDWASASVSVLSNKSVDDAYATDEDATLDVGASAGVLANDASPAASAVVTTSPTHGDLTLDPDGSFTYVPDADYHGPDTFAYEAGAGDPATVEIDVRPVNDAPEVHLNGYCDRSIPFIFCDTEDERDVLEGGTAAQLNGSIRDVEFDAGTLTIDWGDGSTTTASYPCQGTGCAFSETRTYVDLCAGCTGILYFRFEHVYADDPAGASPYVTITATAREGDGTSGSFGGGARVSNVDPTLVVYPDCELCVAQKSDLNVDEGDPVMVGGRVTDPGLDTGTLTIDWGDGSADSTLDLGCSSPGDLCPTASEHAPGCEGVNASGLDCGYFEMQHTYVDGGQYQIALTVTDDDGGSDSGSTTAVVTAVDEPPTISASATTGNGQAYAAGEWTNQDVTVHFTCDDDSGTVTCPPDTVVQSTTSSVGGTATDGGGRSASTSFGPINIDKTPPTIDASAATADGQPYVAGTLTTQSVTVAFGCADAGGSGLATCPADVVVTASTSSVPGQAADNAGNTATASFGPVTIDAGRPSVTVDQASDQADPTGSSPIRFSVVFSEPVSGFTAGDVAIGGTAQATTAVVTGGPANYTVSVSGMAAAGTVTAAIAADRASDAAGNGNTASSSTDDSVTWVPNRQPTAVITDGQCSPAGPASASVTVTVADPDGDPLTVALTANSNRTLIPDAQVSIGGSDDTRTIGVAAAAGRSGTATLRFGVSDGIATVSLTLTVRVGTNGSQTLVGTSGSDILLGLGGTDVLGGGDGADLLCGGDGNDIMTGGAGADTVDGQAGNDGVDGGAGSDAVFGGPGNDGLRGGAGADRFSGGPGRDLALDFRANQGDTQDGTIP